MQRTGERWNWLEATPEPLLHGPQEMPLPALQGAFDPVYPAGDQWYWLGDPAVSTVEDYMFGRYDVSAVQFDRVAHSYPYFLPVVAAGNDRGPLPEGVKRSFTVTFSSQLGDLPVRPFQTLLPGQPALLSVVLQLGRYFQHPALDGVKGAEIDPARAAFIDKYIRRGQEAGLYDTGMGITQATTSASSFARNEKSVSRSVSEKQTIRGPCINSRASQSAWD